MLSLFCAIAWMMAASEPPLHPSGMDLLYDDRIPLLESGEPVVTLGIASGEDRVAVRAAQPLRVEFYDAGVFKQAVVPAGTAVEVTIRRAQPAQRAYFVDLGGISPVPPEKVVAALKLWRERGLTDVQPLEEGTVLGMNGRVLDNRDLRLVVPAASLKQARARADSFARRFNMRAQPRERLAERPWGELQVTASQGPLGTAISYVRFRTAEGPASDSMIEVAGVEFAKGYAWHGRADRRYRGEIYAVVDPNGKLAVVNALGTEAMLEGVVPAEIFASAPPDALRAQAVAARNTLLAKLGRRHHTEPFHMCSEQHCQVYAGVGKEDPRTSAAVRATVGQALFFRGQLVDAVYSANCGGHTEDNDVVWGDMPNLALRGRPDFAAGADDPALLPFAAGITASNVEAFVHQSPASFCAQAQSPRADKFRWQKSLNQTDLQAMLGRVYPSLGVLRDVQLGARGRGGRVASLKLLGTQGAVTVQRELPIRQLFGNLNSAAFALTVAHDADGLVRKLTFTGGGWGHGVGMCQLGAIGRSEAGQGYAEILAYYYNGAHIERLYGAK